jgi:GAF domain-containing protein
VVPIVHEGELLGVLDLDSPVKARFDAVDVKACVNLIRMLAPRLAPVEKASAEG